MPAQGHSWVPSWPRIPGDATGPPTFSSQRAPVPRRHDLVHRDGVGTCRCAGDTEIGWDMEMDCDMEVCWDIEIGWVVEMGCNMVKGWDKSDPAQEQGGRGISIPGDVCLSWTCHPWDTCPQHRHPPMRHTAGPQGHQRHVHSLVSSFQFYWWSQGCGGALVQRWWWPRLWGTPVPQSPSAGVSSAEAACPPPPATPSVLPASALLIVVVRAPLVVEFATVAAPAVARDDPQCHSLTPRSGH